MPGGLKLKRPFLKWKRIIKENQKTSTQHCVYCIPGTVAPGPRFYNRFPSPIGRKTTLKTGTQHTLTVTSNYEKNNIHNITFLSTNSSGTGLSKN